MSYAGHANLITLQLADSSAQVDSRLTRMLATSLVVHAVLLLGLMSVRFAPTLQQPLASYHVDLVTLPEPRVAQEPATVKKATVPPPLEPQVTRLAPSPVVQKTPPAPIQIERVTQSIVDAVDSVAVPQSREMAPIVNTPAVTPKAEPISPKSQSTAVPSPKISIPGQVPQMAKVIPAPKPTEIQAKSRPQNLVTDSVKHILQSVVVPEMRKSKVPPTKKIQAIPVPIPPILDSQPKPRKKLDGIVIPSNAPKLASLDLTKPRPKKAAVVPPETVAPNALDSKIAKLIIPEVQVPEAHHILSKPTDSGMQNTTTTLQVSGSSPKGSAYWGRVWSKIDREWIAPQVDIRSDRPLRVILAFRIERQGGVKNLAIEQSSGNEYYDLAAKRAVLDATPLPPFASDMPEPFYDIQFQFTVNLDS